MCTISGKYLLFLLSGIFLIASCDSSVPPPSWDNCSEMVTNSDIAKSPTANHLVVYLDTSASMSGYVAEKGNTSFAVSPDKETVYSKTLLELRTLVSSLNSQPTILLRKVAANVDSPLSDDLNISRAAFSRNIYNGPETNLAGAIKSFTQPINNDENPPRFHILITDGVQSTKTVNEGTACDTGSDWRCVRGKIKELLNKGWGGSILGIKSEFRGIIYSEINNGKIQYDSGQSINRFRPFYLYILSPNHSEVEKLVNGLKKRLTQIAQENRIEKEQLFREYPLMMTLVEGNPTSGSHVAAENSSLLKVEQDNAEKAQFNVLVDTQTASKGYKPFSVKIKISWTEHSLDMGTPEEIFKLIKWEIKQISMDESEKHRYPELKKIGEPVLKDGETEIRFEAGWQEGVGKKDWRMYRLSGKLNPDAFPPWVITWSTRNDTTGEAGNKTLNLDSALATFWDNEIMRNYTVADICFRVGDK